MNAYYSANAAIRGWMLLRLLSAKGGQSAGRTGVGERPEVTT